MQIYMLFKQSRFIKVLLLHIIILTVCFIVTDVKRLGPEGKKSSIWQLPAIGTCKFLMVVTDKDSEFFFQRWGFKD